MENPKRMRKTFVILISGKPGVGKTTLANMLLSTFRGFGLKTERISFSRSVKNIATTLGWDSTFTEKAVTLFSDIELAGRKYDKYVWVKHILFAIEDNKDYPLDIVICDNWKYPYEYTYFDSFPLYKVFKVKVESPEREKEDTSAPIEGDLSLSTVDYNYDYIFNNDGDIAYFTAQMSMFVKKLFQSEKENIVWKQV
jgi:DNA polymerase III delta prime subunit